MDFAMTNTKEQFRCFLLKNVTLNPFIEECLEGFMGKGFTQIVQILAIFQKICLIVVLLNGLCEP